MKFLAICAGGNVRSRAFVHHLMYDLGQEALSASHDKQDPATWAMLCNWADRIIVAEPKFLERIAPCDRPKTKVMDVGPDVYGSCWHFVLQARMRAMVDEWARRGYAL